MKKNKISKNWLIKQNKDPFFRQSKIQGYRSRSAFKLIEMNKKFKFIKKNSSLLDLGSCPGGWSQVARKEIIKGKILAVDTKSMEKINKVDFIKGDFLETEILTPWCQKCQQDIQFFPCDYLPHTFHLFNSILEWLLGIVKIQREDKS